MYVDCAGVTDIFIAPDLIKELLTGEDTVR